MKIDLLFYTLTCRLKLVNLKVTLLWAFDLFRISLIAMARFVELCVFLCTLSLVFGERINFSGIGEAILCRSYSSAKNEGILDICKNLWKHATVFPANTKSIDCSTCNYHLQNRNYYRLSSLLKRQQVTCFY